MKIKLLYKFIIVIVLAAIIPLVFAGYKAIDINQKALLYSTRSSHINTVTFLSKRVDNFIEALREKLLFLINSQAVESLDYNSKQVLISSLLTSSDYFMTVSMLNAEGEEYIKTYHPGFKGEPAFFNRSETELFSRARQGPAVSDLYYFESENEGPSLDIIYPLQKSYIFITVMLDNIWQEIKETDIGENAAVFLVDDSGRVLAHPDVEMEGKELNIPPVRAIMERVSIGTMDFEYEGQKRVSAYAPVKSMGWGVVTQQPYRDAYAPVIEAKRNAYRWIILTVLLATAVAYIFAKKLSRPIVSLTEGAKAVASGDFNGTVMVKSRDELNILAETFNNMVKSLKRYNELQIDKIMEERTKTKAVIFSIDDGIILTDYEGRIMLSNDRARELLDLDENLSEGRRIDEYIKGEKTAALFRDLKEAELDLSDDNESKFVKVITDEVTTLGGRKIGKVKVIRDITLEKEIEKLKEKFMQSITHDLKNPLTAIMGMADLVKLKSGENLGSEEKKYIEVLKSEADRLMGMINDILNLAKLESGNMELQKSKFSLSGMLEEIKAAFSAQAENSGIELSVKEAAKDIQIRADSKLIKRVVINLLGNALKYTPRGGTVTMGAEIEHTFVKVYVRDTGEGIPSDMCDKIFDRFKQIRGQSRGGTGIGLNVSKEIVQAHGGRIWAESEPGEGSVFIFTLPKSSDEA